VFIAVAVFLVMTAAGLWMWQAAPQAQESDHSAAGVEDAQDDLENVIWASGKLEPLHWAGLTPEYSGIVQTIYVEEGAWVHAGDLLLELDDAVAASQVQSAEAAVAEAESALAKLRAGATKAELAAAQARVAAAQAQVSLAAGQMLEAAAAIRTAEAQVQIAESNYGELASHPTEAELQVAKAEIGIAEAAVSQTQAAYNVVRGDPQIGSRPESLALYQATAGLEAAKARAAQVEQGATPEQLAVAQAAIVAARAGVEEARSHEPGVQAAVQAAMAEQSSAQAALDDLLDGATAEELAIGEARVRSAQAALATAQATLALSQIRAPFDGLVGAVSVRPGELTNPAQVLILLGDTREMYVETTDLRETDVVRLALEMKVEVTFDALPDQIFEGRVVQIAPVSNTEKGSTNYTVHIALVELDERLRWGMTAFVNIEAPR
jgi:multidrug efflux pump subunit AcrA (membrane-fusion protein)